MQVWLLYLPDYSWYAYLCPFAYASTPERLCADPSVWICCQITNFFPMCWPVFVFVYVAALFFFFRLCLLLLFFFFFIFILFFFIIVFFYLSCHYQYDWHYDHYHFYRYPHHYYHYHYYIIIIIIIISIYCIYQLVIIVLFLSCWLRLWPRVKRTLGHIRLLNTTPSRSSNYMTNDGQWFFTTIAVKQGWHLQSLQFVYLGCLSNQAINIQ